MLETACRISEEIIERHFLLWDSRPRLSRIPINAAAELINEFFRWFVRMGELQTTLRR